MIFKKGYSIFIERVTREIVIEKSEKSKEYNNKKI
jgi:hypothetical protein